MSELLVRRFCERCQAYRDGPSVRLLGSPAHPIAACAVCGEALRAEQQRVTRPLSAELTRAFLFPFSPVVLAGLAGVVVVSWLASFVPLFGGMLSAAVVLGSVFLVIRSSAEGRDDMSSDVELSSSFWSWMSPLARYLATFLVAYAPALVALFVLGRSSGVPVAIGAAVLGTLYLPAGMIVAAHQEGCLGALNPTPGVQIIFRIPGPYFLTLGFLLLSMVVGAATTWVAGKIAAIPVPVLTSLAARLIGLYAPVVMARQLGVLMYEHGEEL